MIVILHSKLFHILLTRNKNRAMKKSQFKLMLSGCALGLAVLASCGGAQQNQQCDANGALCPKNFDTTINGKKVGLYTLENSKGTKVSITNFGGRIVSLIVVDKNGKPQDVVLGFDKVATYADYLHTPSDFGASIGRYANRIYHGKIVCDGDTIQLPINNFGHCLHGGPQGWQYQVYDVTESTPNSLTLVMDSKDGDANFPGNLKATVKFTLTENSEIEIDYTATTDKETVINMTNHSYFNLNGDPNTEINNCHLYINADKYTPVDSSYMPTGEIANVENTPFDLRNLAEIGNKTNLQAENEQIKFGNGYDHNWCLNTYNAETGEGDITKIAATLYSPVTGIQLDVYTNEPGIQCYSGNFLDGKTAGKKGIVYKKHAGICLETQKYPNSPNVKEWPSPYLKPGETYHSYCKFAFSVK